MNEQDFMNQISQAVHENAIVSVSDISGEIIYVNDNFCQISGYSKSELLGQHHRIVKSGFHDKKFFAEMWKTISQGNIWKGEVKNKRKDGTFYWVLSTIVPLKDADGKVYSYVSIRHDITESKAAKDQLIQASKLSSLGEVSAKIAHELCNPLAVIVALAELTALQHKSNDKILDQINKILMAANRMNKLITQMKKYSRNSAEDPREEIALGQVVQNVLILAEPSLKNNHIQVNLFIDENCKNIYGDIVQLESVVQNFITNSIDAFDKPHSGGEIINREIKVRIFGEKDFAIFEYEDNAGGIPDSVQKHMFETFFTTKEVGKGTGLGLSMIRTIVNEHSADLSFNSEIGKGTRFTIKFPYYESRNS